MAVQALVQPARLRLTPDLELEAALHAHRELRTPLSALARVSRARLDSFRQGAPSDAVSVHTAHSLLRDLQAAQPVLPVPPIQATPLARAHCVFQEHMQTLLAFLSAKSAKEDHSAIEADQQTALCVP